MKKATLVKLLCLAIACMLLIPMVIACGEDEGSPTTPTTEAVEKVIIDFRTMGGDIIDGDKEIEIEKAEENNNVQIFEGMNFVITGSVEHFANRNEVKAVIEARGGKVTGSVTSKTNYLINNDTTSTSGKNKKAKELGVPIISEEEFLEMIGG